jgi:hypothetical protein
MAVLIYNISIKLYTTFLCHYIIGRRRKYEVVKIHLLKRKVIPDTLAGDYFSIFIEIGFPQ